MHVTKPSSPLSRVPSQLSQLSKLVGIITLIASTTAPVGAQDLNRDVSADTRVAEILRTCNLQFTRSLLAGEFRFSDYQETTFSRQYASELTLLPRRPTFLYRSSYLFPGAEPQVDLDKFVRASFGDSTAVVGSWAYDSLRRLLLNPDRMDSEARNCFTTSQGNRACYENYRIVEELNTRMGVATAINDCVLPQVRSGAALSGVSAHRLTQALFNVGFMKMRMSSGRVSNEALPGDSPLANAYFRYAGPRRPGGTVLSNQRPYIEWTRAGLFFANMPRFNSFYGYRQIVIEDTDRRSIDLNAYNHAYYFRSGMSFQSVDGQGNPAGEARSLSRDFYTLASVDAGEYLLPGYVKPQQLVGFDVRAQRPGNSSSFRQQGQPNIQVAYRRIHLSPGANFDRRSWFHYDPILVIDAQGEDCVLLDEHEIPHNCVYEDDSGNLRSNNARRRSLLSPPSIGPRILPVLGIIGLCGGAPQSNGDAAQIPLATENCAMPGELIRRYRGVLRAGAASDPSQEAHRREWLGQAQLVDAFSGRSISQTSVRSNVPVMLSGFGQRWQARDVPLYPTYLPFPSASSSDGNSNSTHNSGHESSGGSY